MGIVSVLAQRKAKAEAKKAQTAIMQVAGQNATWDAVSKQWQQYEMEHPGEDMSANSTNPQVQMLRHAVQSAWTDRVNAYAQYTLPDVVAAHQAAKVDPTGKAVVKLNDKNKKSLLEALKGFVEGKITPETPQLILQSQLNQMHNADPFAQIPPPAPKDVLAYSKDQDATKAQEAADKLGDLYAAAGNDPTKWSPAIAQQARQYQNAINAYGGKAPTQQTLDQVKAQALADIDAKLRANPNAAITNAEWAAAGEKPPSATTGHEIEKDSTGTWFVPLGPNGMPEMGPDNQPKRIQIGLPPESARQLAFERAQGANDAKVNTLMSADPQLSRSEAQRRVANEAQSKGWLTDPDTINSTVQSAYGTLAGLYPSDPNAAAGKVPAWYAPWLLSSTDANGNTTFVPRSTPLLPFKAATNATFATNGKPIVTPDEAKANGTKPNPPAYQAGDMIYPGGIPVADIGTVGRTAKQELLNDLISAGMPRTQAEDWITQNWKSSLYAPAPAKQATTAPAKTKASPPPATGRPSGVPSGWVQMRGPDGATGWVPPDKVSAAMAQGATKVGQ